MIGWFWPIVIDQIHICFSSLKVGRYVKLLFDLADEQRTLLIGKVIRPIVALFFLYINFSDFGIALFDQRFLDDFLRIFHHVLTYASIDIFNNRRDMNGRFIQGGIWFLKLIT